MREHGTNNFFHRVHHAQLQARKNRAGRRDIAVTGIGDKTDSGGIYEARIRREDFREAKGEYES